jgi:hypothetical protein
MTISLEEIPVELGCVCEAAGDGPFESCYEPAAFYAPEADESRPIYFCLAHRPMNNGSLVSNHPRS